MVCKCACHYEFDEVIVCAHCPCKNITKDKWERQNLEELLKKEFKISQEYQRKCNNLKQKLEKRNKWFNWCKAEMSATMVHAYEQILDSKEKE